ncbi:hypothetical protein K505DRAFT_372226 [Melanomma pulvis-pyrius CBS 109.77]|uniref:Uncharacterized protein n=1 Tax=Melanomma pulvis-pyrius CBS 109.77 TaxID=1314802 RepID=A0A6A6XN19_9PLEO|nr:hypothetical protein K505DRAFT_372226 [Melanomma pulvis-pyrius CBS 109.77]
MLSDEDVQDIFRLIPPSKSLSSGLPSLLLLSTGTGFITSSRVLNQFNRLVESESKRLSVALLSHDLAVDPEVVLQLARASPSLALLSEDNSDIITKIQRDSIEQHLRTLVVSQIVSKATFSHENDVSIESIDALTHSGGDSPKLQDDLLEVDGHLLSTDYHYSVLEIMKQGLNDALRDAAPVEFTSGRLLECPMWYITFRLNWLLKVTYMAPQFRIETSPDSITCIPKNSVIQKKDAEISRLQAGQVPNIDLQVFSKEYRELYPSLADVQDYIQALPDIYAIKSTGISQKWLLSFSEGCVRFLEVNGYADFTANIKGCFPQDCHRELYDLVEKQITTTYDQQSNTKLYRAGDFIVAGATYDRERDSLLKMAKVHATTQWHQLKENLDQDLKFQISEIINTIPSELPLRCAIAKDKSVEKALDERYWNDVSDLESTNEAEFSTFWIERVVSRIQNYTEGLKYIEDTKLRDQLADLLSTYIQKELLPDSVSKARSQALVLSRKTRKHVQKLESTLKSGKMDLSGVIVAVEKFGKKQGLPDLDTASLTGTKDVLISDMIRKMQKKQADGPLLFLTLVIVLLAKQQLGVGVVYATGKFAPKLLKQLKSVLSTERYEQLEGWKELAKAGTLTSEDKEDMKRLAGEL